MPLVSIIIPNFNSASFLPECLESCLLQKSTLKEIIVVDDHSTDNSLSILESYQNNWPSLLRVFVNPQKGACSARNYGFEKSSGEFIQFLDSDDILNPNKIENQLKELKKSPDYYNNLIHCQWGRFYNDDISKVDWWGPHELIKRNLKPADWLIANHMSMTGCWLTPRKLIEKGGLWDETLKRNQDGEFFSRIMLNASKVLYCDDAKVYYRSGNSLSISSAIKREAMESLFKSLLLIESYIFSLENSPRSKESVANRFQEFVYLNYINNPDLAIIAENKVYELGGSSLALSGGRGLKLLSNILGWKQALKIKKLLSTSTLN